MATGTAISTVSNDHKGSGRIDDSVRSETDEGVVMSIVQKCRAMVEAWNSERTPFASVGLFLPDDSLGRWELIIRAKSKWLDPDRLEHFRLVTNRLRGTLTASEFQSLYRIVLLPNDERWSLRMTPNNDGRHENVLFNGVLMRFAFEIFERPETRKQTKNGGRAVS